MLIGCLVGAFVAIMIVVSDAVTSGSSSGAQRTTTEVVLCLSLVGLSVVSYLSWPSRWNIPAHIALAFSLIAYVLPIAGLNSLGDTDGRLLSFVTKITSIGLLAMIAGVAVGSSLTRRHFGATDRVVVGGPQAKPVGLGRFAAPDVVERRVKALLLISVLGMLYALARMGFVPALADDPFSAKYFRGAYAASYAPVASVYRACTTAIALVLPMMLIYAIRRRRPAEWCLLGASLGLMLLVLLRDPAVSGVILALGVLIAARGGSMKMYTLIVLAVYTIGSALYYLLSLLGVSSFDSTSTDLSLPQRVAAGAPDVSDQFKLVQAWLAHPQFTYGRTIFGGLVPGNYHWNPSVWSLSTVNPGQDISSIVSGGIRLPAPIWGYVCFGWAGVVLICFVSGLATGWLGAVARRFLPLPTRDATIAALVAYLALQDIVVTFYRLSYLSIVQMVVVFWILHRKRSAAPAELRAAFPDEPMPAPAESRRLTAASGTRR